MIVKELQKRILSSMILIPIVIFFIFQSIFFFAFFLSILFLVTSYEWLKMNKISYLKITGIFYLCFSFIVAYLLREKFSLTLFVLVLIICIFTDIGGYVFGKFFKGPKLIKISPKKTYAGVLGGFILSLAAAFIYSKYIIAENFINLDLSILKDIFSDRIYFLFILFISFVSQVGDLIISYFKRLAKVKDTGNILPGHGGLLDRLDGIIFAIPLSYLILSYLA